MKEHSHIKLIYLGLFLVFIIVLLLGFVCPSLVSSSSEVKQVIGVALVFVIPILIYGFYRRAKEEFK